MGAFEVTYARYVERSKNQREVSALKKQYKLIDVAHKVNAERLIQRAAYQKATLEDLEKDLDENGWTEPFQQSQNLDPYDRKRPNADLYISLSAQYTRTMKQLDAMLPKGAGTATDDTLLSFLGSPDDRS